MGNYRSDKFILAVQAYHLKDCFMFSLSIAKALYHVVMITLKQTLDEFKGAKGPVIF